MRKVFTLLFCVLLSACWMGCSDDNDQINNATPNENTGDSVSWNKITMVVNTSQNASVRLSVYGKGNQTTNLNIDWGDGTTSSGEFDINEEHIYQESKEYTIIISGNDISGFNCPNLDIVSLDLTQCPKLTSLNCYSSNLAVLDLSKNASLVNLYCYDNKLTSLNLEAATGLEYLDCNTNQLTTLDITMNTELEYINCNYNELAALNTSNNMGLRWLYCTNNRIEELDFTCNAKIRQIYCAGNQLSKEAYETIYTSLPTVNDNSATLWVDSDAPNAYNYLAEKGWGFNRWP